MHDLDGRTSRKGRRIAVIDFAFELALVVVAAVVLVMLSDPDALTYSGSCVISSGQNWKFEDWKYDHKIHAFRWFFVVPGFLCLLPTDIKKHRSVRVLAGVFPTIFTLLLLLVAPGPPTGWFLWGADHADCDSISTQGWGVNTFTPLTLAFISIYWAKLVWSVWAELRWQLRLNEPTHLQILNLAFESPVRMERAAMAWVPVMTMASGLISGWMSTRILETDGSPGCLGVNFGHFVIARWTLNWSRKKSLGAFDKVVPAVLVSWLSFVCARVIVSDFHPVLSTAAGPLCAGAMLSAVFLLSSFSTRMHGLLCTLLICFPTLSVSVVGAIGMSQHQTLVWLLSASFPFAVASVIPEVDPPSKPTRMRRALAGVHGGVLVLGAVTAFTLSCLKHSGSLPAPAPSMQSHRQTSEIESSVIDRVAAVRELPERERERRTAQHAQSGYIIIGPGQRAETLGSDGPRIAQELRNAADEVGVRLHKEMPVYVMSNSFAEFQPGFAIHVIGVCPTQDAASQITHRLRAPYPGIFFREARLVDYLGTCPSISSMKIEPGD